MRATSARGQQVSPTRLLEILTDRFGAFEAIASSSITLARVAPDEERPMDPLGAEAVLEFGEDLRGAAEAVRARGQGWPAA
ncbi:MAG TPA: hypothetical protein VGC13_02810 [Longimicrobium sp.]|uniref:hypothetical protein n=1 Tax=Longimicrobium sp. TaxID=2029185 RepID=UPI002ED7F88D